MSSRKPISHLFMSKTIAALDVGTKRIGVALADGVARLPRPYTTLANDSALWQNLRQLLNECNVAILVVGLPRNLSGDDTAQTHYTQEFVARLQEAVDIPVHTIDEAGTSRQAQSELQAKKKPFNKAAIDALAAAYILEDFLATQQSIAKQK